MQKEAKMARDEASKQQQGSTVLVRNLSGLYEVRVSDSLDLLGTFQTLAMAEMFKELVEDLCSGRSRNAA
jgi:hypothetical protein